MNASSSDLRTAGELLRSGGLVAFPTETVYGLGANAFDPVSVARVFEAKQRPSFDPLIVHIATAKQLEELVLEVTPLARELASRFWPGPLTLVLSKSAAVPSIVTSGLDSVGVRMPSHPVARELLAYAAVPVAAPSANRFGHLSPTRAKHVVDSLGAAVDLVIDGGATEWGVESTVVDVRGDHAVVLRHGATTVEQLESILGSVEVQVATSVQPSSPGQLDSHYAPDKPLHIFDGSVPENLRSVGFLAFEKPPAFNTAATEVLSRSGNLVQAAANLFDALHRLDASEASAIYAELVPNEGLGRAINDRITRAAAS